MGRPMRPVNPADGAVQQFAAGLRELREQAGNPTFRQLAKHAHYSATTLSVACSGTVLPSLDVTLALVRACHGTEDIWRRRWRHVAGQTVAGQGKSAGGKRGPVLPDLTPGRARSLMGRAVPWTGWAVACAVVALVLGGVYRPASATVQVPERSSAWQAGLPPMYVGITRCDPGSFAVLSKAVTLPRPVRLAGRLFRAGSIVGTIYLMYSPRCSEGWPHFSPSRAFFNQPGTLILSSRSTPDDSVSTSPAYHVIRFADGEPMLTVPGCVDAEATVEFGGGGPSVAAATACFQRA